MEVEGERTGRTACTRTSNDLMIDLKDVSVSFQLPNGRERTVLEDVTFHLNRSEMAYLVGPTGSGKSTILRLLYMDLFPDQGVAQIGDYRSDLIDEDDIPYLRRSIGVVFQDFQLLPDRTVFENIAFALEVTGKKRSFIKQRVLEILGLVGLSHKRKAMPDDLSGGEQQRVVIARALANEPRILLADEPTGNLDPEASSEIMDLLKVINNRGMAVLMVTHDYEVIKKHPFRTIRIHNGKLEEISIESLA